MKTHVMKLLTVLMLTLLPRSFGTPVVSVATETRKFYFLQHSALPFCEISAAYHFMAELLTFPLHNNST